MSPGYVGDPEIMPVGLDLDLDLAVRDCVSRARCFRQMVAHISAHCAGVAVGGIALLLHLGAATSLMAGLVAMGFLSYPDMMKRTSDGHLSVMYRRSPFVAASSFTMAVLAPACVVIMIHGFFGRAPDVVWTLALSAWSGLMLSAAVWYSYFFRRSYRAMVASEVMLS